MYNVQRHHDALQAAGRAFGSLLAADLLHFQTPRIANLSTLSSCGLPARFGGGPRPAATTCFNNPHPSKPNAYTE